MVLIYQNQNQLKKAILITLNDELIVGQGFHRTCFRHPEKHDLCVKISHSENQKAQTRELSYYQLLVDRGIRWDCLSRYHGTANTNIGIGHVFDLIIDSNNQPSKTLEYYLKGEVPEGITASLLTLKNYLLKHSIITTELKPRNIVCRNKDGVIKDCVIIDDIGNTEFFPVSNYSPLLATLKINRKWRRFETKLIDLGLSPLRTV